MQNADQKPKIPFPSNLDKMAMLVAVIGAAVAFSMHSENLQTESFNTLSLVCAMVTLGVAGLVVLQIPKTADEDRMKRFILFFAIDVLGTIELLYAIGVFNAWMA